MDLTRQHFGQILNIRIPLILWELLGMFNLLTHERIGGIEPETPLNTPILRREWYVGLFSIFKTCCTCAP